MNFKKIKTYSKQGRVIRRTKKFLMAFFVLVISLWSIGAPSIINALAVDSVTVSPTSIEINFDDDILSSALSSSDEVGASTKNASDLRNYLLQTGSPLVTQKLSRYLPYNMSTEYDASNHILRIYGIENLNLSQSNAWKLQIAGDTIQHATSTSVFVDAYQTTGTVGASQDPAIDSIVNNKSASGCYGYPCALTTGDEIVISGSNYTTSTTVVWENWATQTADDFTSLSATQIVTTVPEDVSSLGRLNITLRDVSTSRVSNTRHFIAGSSSYGIVLGKFTLADESTPVDNVELRVEQPNYFGSGSLSKSHANGKFAVGINVAGNYEARFITPANCSEAAPSKQGSITVALNATTNLGTKKFKTPTVSGYVKAPLSQGGAVLPGVTVRVYKYDWTVEQMAISGVDGSWKVYIDNTGVNSINLGVEAEPSDYHQYILGYKASVRGVYDQTLSQNQTVTGLNVYLSKTNVTGTIKTPTGSVSDSNPVPDTAVPNTNVQLHSQDWSYEQWTNTDENGAFQFGGVPDGSTYILEMETPWSGDFSGYARTTISDLVIGSSAPGYSAETGITNLNLSTKAVSSALRYSSPNTWGRVLLGGSPLADAWINIHKEGAWYNARTDTNGKFKLSLSKGHYFMEIEPPISAGAARYNTEIDITSATANNLGDVVLAAPNVAGYIYGPTGTSDAAIGQMNVWVDICPYNNPGTCYGANTNNAGYFGVGTVPNGTWKLELRVDSWNTIYVAPAQKILVIADGSPSTLDGVSVSGNLIIRLTDASVGGLKGKVCAPGDTASCEHPQSNVGVNLRTQNAMNGFNWSQTDANGNFAFGNISAGLYDLEIDPWGSADYSRKLYTITVNGDDSVDVGSTHYESRNVNLFLSLPTVSGHLYTPAFVSGHTSTSNPTPNEPVQWAWVNFHQEGPMSGTGGWYGASTNENGVFQFGGVKPGANYVLEAESQWGTAYARKRYTGITMTDLDADGSADECSYNGADDGDATDGACDLNSLLGTATGLDSPVKALRVGIPNLRGQIVDPNDNGVQNCWVMIHDEMWMNQAGGNTDQNGYFNLGGLSDGTYQVEVNMPWGGEQAYTQPSGLTVVISNEIATIKENNSALTNNKITLTTPKKILTGYVYKDVNSNGSYDSGTDTAVANARVEAHRDMGGGFFETVTNSSGEYTLKISGGNWWVETRPDMGNVNTDWVYSAPPTRVNFPATTTKECKGTSARCLSADATSSVIAAGLDFGVETANCTLTGYVKLPDGTAVANAWVDVHKGMGPGNGANTDSNGRFSVKIPAGTYEIMVMPNTSDYGSPDPVKVKVASGGTTDAGTLYLKSRSSHIKGSITDNTGNAIGNVMVNAWQMSGPGWANAFSDSNTGAYDLTLSEGIWGVMIMPMSSQYVYQGGPLEVTVEANNSSSGNDFVLKIADTTVKVSVVDTSNNRVTDLWGGVWVKDTSIDDMLDFGGAMEDMMTKGGILDEGGDMAMASGGGGGSVSPMGGGMEKGGFQGGGLVNGYTEIKIPGGSADAPTEYEIGLHTPPGAQYTLSATKTIEVISGTDQEIELMVKRNDATIQGHLYLDNNSNGSYDSGEEVSGLRSFVHAHRSDGGWQMTESNSDGSYSLILCSGTWYLDAWINVLEMFGSSKYMIINEKVATNVGSGGTETHNFKLRKLDASISGTVTDPDGVVMDNVWVFVDYGSSEMVTEFKGQGPGIGVLTDINGDYTLNVAAGNYKIGAGTPPWDSRNLIGPDILEVTVQAAEVSVSNDLEFKTSDATIVGEITFNSEKKAGFIRAWSDSGGATGIASLDGTYTLDVVSGDVWHISAAAKISGQLYESAESSVTTVAGANSKNLVLLYKNLTIPDSKTASFSSSDSKSIILSNGLTVEAPAGSIASSGTITVTITPKTDAQPDSKDKPLGISYDFVAKDSSGNEITSFVNDIQVVIPYDEDLIVAAGYIEDDLRPKYYDETTNTWENWKSVSQDKTNNTFTITTDHFTPGGLTGGRVVAAATTTPSSTPASSSNPGGGSGSTGVITTGPGNVSVWMNWGADKTVKRTVTLSLNATNAAEVIISNAVDFAGANWETYQTSKYWTLSENNGEKIVYVKYRDEDYNESSVVSDTIILEQELTETAINEKDLVKTADSSALYLILNNQRHIFPHLAVYQSWSYPSDFSTVKLISSIELAIYPEGDPVPFRNGSMFRGTATSLHGKESSAVFYVEDSKLRPVLSGEIYQSLFNDPGWNLVTWVPDDLLSKFEYSLGENVSSNNLHPNGSLVRYEDSSAVYLIENGKKRQFNSWDALVANGYANRKILLIPASEIYVTDQAIGSLAETLVTPVIAALVF